MDSIGSSSDLDWELWSSEANGYADDRFRIFLLTFLFRAKGSWPSFERHQTGR